jgi:hypothetical protein
VADAAFRFCLRELLGEVGTFEGARKLPLPDVVIALWIELQVELTLFLQFGREPGIVAPVRLDDDRIVGFALAQKFIAQGQISPRVPGVGGKPIVAVIGHADRVSFVAPRNGDKVWSHDIGRALRAAHAIEASWVQVNQGLGQSPGHSYGG